MANCKLAAKELQLFDVLYGLVAKVVPILFLVVVGRPGGGRVMSSLVKFTNNNEVQRYFR